MNTASSALWPWLTLAGLGAFHGLNPAMGWLFAVALGLHRRSRGLVVLALAPIVLGHVVAVGSVVLALTFFGTVMDATFLGRGAGILLLALAATHAFARHRTPLRIGMQTGLAGLALWSFMMASAHGAGFMLIPALLSLCVSSGMGGELTASTSLPVSFAALAVHTGAMLAVIGTVSLVVYDQGLAFLRRGWVNLDVLWSVALAGGGIVLLAG
ncbi:hypothetical protein [Microvirga lotononidis]|uniref:Hydrogenase/urease accessory protein n=1 Tax=Microvirga lotononidis TaxID=864069 RepID=I4YWP8_9HYPH|nr:hypothetical protein [Microvirga lotononidis]EIM28390.1 hypothetical protein MicloDRAFT_00049730 [Microvirga lotononidis]WQO27526.1 hypothetical protein U0023_23305 [Microvirga lotononidis]